MKVAIRYKKITGGRSSIYLDSPGLNPRKKYLGEFVFDAPKTIKEKEHNRNIMAVVEQVKFDLETKLRNSKHRIIEDRTGEDFVKYYIEWKNTVNRSNPRRAQSVLNKLQEFLVEKRKGRLLGYQITQEFCEDFAYYIKSKTNGETPRTYFQKFKQCLKRAYKEKVIEINPRDIEVRLASDNAIKKPLLNEEEIKLLAQAPTSNNVIKQAYFVSLLMGFDFATIKSLKPKHIDLARNEIIYERSKVERGRRKVMPTSVFKIIESRLKEVLPDDFLFNIGTWEGAIKSIRASAKAVGIDKKITWHSARHSFATNLLVKEVNLRVIADLLDHKSLKNVMRYTDVVNSSRIKALEKLDDIDLI